MAIVENANRTSGPWSVHGSEDPEILVAGHSHALVLLFSMDAGHGPEGYRAAVVLDTKRRSSSFLDEHYWDLLARAATGKNIAIAWNGNQHNASFLLEAQPAFRVFHEGDDLSGEVTWLPQQLLRAYWAPSLLELRAALPRLTSVATVYLLGSPPPKSDGAIRSVVQEDPYFIAQATSLGMSLADLKITPAATRLAMWSILQDMIRECADEAGAVFLPVPDDVTDINGILLEELSAPDATHANAAYGARLWSELSKEMRKDSSS